MSKRQAIVVCVVISNVLMIIGFVLSSIYMWNFLKTEINEGQSYNEQRFYVIPYIEDTGFQVQFKAMTLF
jgi:hypothetical protein